MSVWKRKPHDREHCLLVFGNGTVGHAVGDAFDRIIGGLDNLLALALIGRHGLDSLRLLDGNDLFRQSIRRLSGVLA